MSKKNKPELTQIIAAKITISITLLIIEYYLKISGAKKVNICMYALFCCFKNFQDKKTLPSNGASITQNLLRALSCPPGKYIPNTCKIAE